MVQGTRQRLLVPEAIRGSYVPSIRRDRSQSRRPSLITSVDRKRESGQRPEGTGAMLASLRLGIHQ